MMRVRYFLLGLVLGLPIYFCLFDEEDYKYFEADNFVDTSEIQYQIIANNKDKEYFIWFADSTKDVYNFHPNRKLSYYINSNKREMNGEAIYFHDDGSLESIINHKEGKIHGIVQKFYPSGNLSSTKHFKDDSLRGYFVDYYDKYNCKKAEYFATPLKKQEYIYKRTYDSANQNVISILDHREIEIKKSPNLTMDDLKLPWER